MEGVSVNVYNGLKQYWKTKRRGGYERLNRRRRRTAELGGESRRKNQFWRIKLTRKLKLRFNFRFSPKKLLIRFRDAYVNMMLRVANSRAIGGGFSGGGFAGFGSRPIKEYDEKMLVQIYKSMIIAHGQAQLPVGAARVNLQ